MSHSEQHRPRPETKAVNLQTLFTMVSASIIVAECVLIFAVMFERAAPPLTETLQIYTAFAG